MRAFKIIVNSIIFLAVISCNSQKILNDSIKRNIKVYKIDSIKNVYVYYAKSDDENLNSFRILSKKDDSFCKEKIMIDKEYKKISLTNLIIQNSSPNRQKGISFNNTVIYLTDSLTNRQIFASKNFVGKCYKK